jgi:SagB-type dehydrogenase family enzyme
MQRPDAAPWPLSRALHIDVVVHHVEGLAPGAYRYAPVAHALQPRRVGTSLRHVARAAALDQDVVGDAAAVFVLAIDRAALRLDAAGPARGYRHAMIEAGCIGERVYLEAVSRGLGVCTVGGFYDDEAAALVAAEPTREWIVQFTALGLRAT